jgi:hypothetical protein
VSMPSRAPSTLSRATFPVGMCTKFCTTIYSVESCSVLRRRHLAANMLNNSPLIPTFSVVAFFELPTAFFVGIGSFLFTDSLVVEDSVFPSCVFSLHWILRSK